MARNQAMAARELRQRTYARMVKRLREFRDLGMSEEEAVVDATLLLIRAYELTGTPGMRPRPIDELADALSRKNARSNAKRRAKAVR